MKKLIGATLILLTTSLSYSQTNDNPEIITDRPDQTESANTVPKNTLQLETGFIMEQNGDIKNYAYNTSLLRYGLFDNFELRFVSSKVTKLSIIILDKK